ncbi:MAG: AsmA family protein [Hyphomicrobium sp.]|nr:AsmA family protein [Hyphomicrobium sp.]
MAVEADTAGAGSPQWKVRWGWLILLTLIVIPLGIAALIFFPPANLITSRIERMIEDATGRDVTVGASRYEIRETVTVEFDDVVLSGPGGDLARPVFRAGRVRATVPLADLTKGNPVLTSLELEAPVLNLTRDAAGQPNWTVKPSAKAGQAASPMSALGLPATTIKNGTFLYTDAANAAAMRLESIDARIVNDPKFGGAAANGSFVYEKEPLDFTLTLSDAEAAFQGKASPVTLGIKGKHLIATLSGEAAVGEAPLLAGEIEASSPSAQGLATWLGFEGVVPEQLSELTVKTKMDVTSGETNLTGSAKLANEPVSYDVLLGNIRDVIAKKASAIKAKLSGANLNADIAGELSPGAKTLFKGDVAADSTAIGKFATALGFGNAEVAKIGKGSISGKAAIEEKAVDLENAAFDIDGRAGNFTGRIDTAGARPRVTGALALDALDLDPLLGRTAPAPTDRKGLAPGLTPEAEAPLPFEGGFGSTWDALAAELDEMEAKVTGETIQGLAPDDDAVDAPAAAPSASPPAVETRAPAKSTAKAPSQPKWSTTPIDLTSLRAVDLDLAVTAKRLKLGSLDMSDGRAKAKLENGDLAATIEDVAVGGGNASGMIDLKARAKEHEAAVSINMKGVDAEPISRELSGKALLAGASNVEIRSNAKGRNLDQLMATLGGSAKFDMTKGQLKGWDIERMLNQFWNYGGWGFNEKRATRFDKLTAKYDIKNGVVKSAPDLAMTGPVAQLRSRGDVVMPTKRINQTLNIEKLPIPILIKGDWTQNLWIGPSFLAGLAPDGEAGRRSAQGLGPAEAVPLPPVPDATPANIKAAAERILASPRAATVLPASDIAFLKSIAGTGGTE